MRWSNLARRLEWSVILAFGAFSLMSLQPGHSHAETKSLVSNGSPTTGESASEWGTNTKCFKHVGSERDPGFWLAEGQFGDGVIRADLRVDRKLTLGVAFRASAGTDGNIVGYNLRFTKDEMQLERIDSSGEIVQLTDWEGLARLKKYERIHLTIVARGDLIIAQLNAPEGQHIASVMARDSTYSRGQVGLRRAERAPAQGCVEKLTRATICDAHAEFPPEPPRFLDLSGAELPEGGLVVDTLGSSTSVVQTNIGGVVDALCKNFEFSRLRIETPLKYVDPHFLEEKARKGLELGENGYVLDASYKDPAMVNEVLEALHARHPEKTKLIKIGESTQGRPIHALAISDDIKSASDKPAVLIDGAQHGNEPLSVEIVLDAANVILESSDEQVATWRKSLVIWVIPTVNPDGLHEHVHTSWRMGRKNGRDADESGEFERRDGVDLNRNYPWKWGSLGEEGSKSDPRHHHHRGSGAASEPETKAVLSLTESEHPIVYLSYHTGTTAILPSYTIDGTMSPEPNESMVIARELEAVMPRHPKDNRKYEVRDKLYSVDGTSPNHIRHSYGTVAFVFEASRFSSTDRLVKRQVLDAVAESWKLLLDRAAVGPTIRGRVIDQHGNPVVAKVELSGQKTFEGERWMTRCRDGRFDRVMTEPGTYTVKAKAHGVSGRAKVKVAGQTEVIIQLELPDDAPRPECPEAGSWWPEVSAATQEWKQRAAAGELPTNSEEIPATPPNHVEEPNTVVSAPTTKEPNATASDSPPSAAPAAEKESVNQESDAQAKGGCACTVGPSPDSPWGLTSLFAAVLGLAFLFRA